MNFLLLYSKFLDDNDISIKAKEYINNLEESWKIDNILRNFYDELEKGENKEYLCRHIEDLFYPFGQKRWHYGEDKYLYGDSWEWQK